MPICTSSPTAPDSTHGRGTALHTAIDHSILQLHLQSLSGGREGLNILERYHSGETDLLAMSFEMEAYLEAVG